MKNQIMGDDEYPQNGSKFDLDITQLSSVEPKDVNYLWYPYIPAGKITMLDADPESGKTFLSLTIAANLTVGKVMSNSENEAKQSLEPRSVLFLGAEDDLGDTIRPRFDAAGGDASKFYALNGFVRRLTHEDIYSGISLGHIDQLEQAIKQIRPGLVIVDPFQAFLGARIDMHRANEVRPVLSGIGKLAAKYDVAFLLNRHLAKSFHQKGMMRGLGSVDIVAAARSVLFAGAIPASENEFLLAHNKCSVARRGPSLRYKISEDMKVKILGISTMSHDDLVKDAKSNAQPVRIAEAFLREILKDGPLSVAELDEAAAAQGISRRTLSRARASLGVEASPTGYQGRWEVGLPTSIQD